MPGCTEIDHRKLGPLKVPVDEILHFDGIPGFPEARRFALVTHDRGDQVAWLACLDDPELALPVLDLRRLRADVCQQLGREDLEVVAAEDAGCVELLGIVNMRYSPPRLNLEAPLVIHSDTRRGAQLILERPLEIGSSPPPDASPASDGVEAPDVEGPGEHSP